MEPEGFIKTAFITLWQEVIKILGLIGSRLDKRSIEGEARKHRIPVIHILDANSSEAIGKLYQLSPDVIINQSELLLKGHILIIPKIGIINRHGSLLPNFRGRLASFWSHAHEPPEYCITIHFVNKNIDSGPIISQKRLEIDPRLSYFEVLDILFKESPPLILEALEKINSPDFSSLPNNYEGTSMYFFPTLQEVKRYRELMKKRRLSKGGEKSQRDY